VRYIGNKTKLLDFIGRVLDEHAVRDGHAFDAFSGTATVGRFFKRRGFRVTTCDLMTYSFVLQRAYVELDRVPGYRRVLDADRDLSRRRSEIPFLRHMEERFGTQADLFADPRAEFRGLCEVTSYLEQFISPETGFVTRQYAPDSGGEPGDRMFFTRANAQRIDAARTRIHEWRREDLLDDSEFFLLLACLIEGADAVANTTGVYAAFVKAWQSNALRSIRLPIPDLVVGSGLHCRAIQGDVNTVIGEVGPVSVLYLDPPYNNRQYSSYYHVPELLAKGWFDGEPDVRGKTGLIEDADKKSQWSTSGGCVQALEVLLAKADARHVLMSYNSEGIIPEAEIRRLLKMYGNSATFRIYEQEYVRYRSDSDHEQRQYLGDSVTEKIYYVRREASPRTRARALV
jgi:adenine-specific DNA-methyltransferase